MSARFHIPPPLQAGEQALPEAVFRHAVQVLRLRLGETLVLFDGEGQEASAELIRLERREAWVRVAAPQALSRESPLPLCLAQGIAKGERMDFVLQKAVELGVAEIQPLLTERSVLRLEAERWERKLAHWQGVVQAACEQCGRNRLPTLHPVRRLDDWLAGAAGQDGLKLLLDPRADQGLASLARPTRATLLIGPEGGLSPAEIEQGRRAGFQGLRLGPRVLRTETAALTALAVLQARWGDLDSSATCPKE
ncbi:MAG TPA: 16S rRNA (uracil(1498)-N(3))-methyltransferase [Nevskiaceae bacterium]|nr:16S rRNA (uracil(1498)-N(3))-methyltransferase [Nevskiaceae bacterium]